MKSYLILLSFLFLTAITTSFVLAVPVNDNSDSEQGKAIRSKRDVEGVFDSIANGFGALVGGVKKVTDSVFVAFSGIFSTNNKNALSDGFTSFKNSMSDAFSGMFGSKGEKVTNGLNKVKDKVTEAWNGKEGSSNSGSAPAPAPVTESSAPSKSAPDGQVPQEETT